MMWNDPQLHSLGNHGPLYWIGIEPKDSEYGDFRTHLEIMLYKLELRYRDIVKEGSSE